MLGNNITIQGQTLPIREFNGERVVTLRDIADVHGTNDVVLRNNFNNNRKHFLEGQDFHQIRGKEACIKFIRGSNTTQINVFTESGYLMLAKSMTDDLAWEVQRELVNRYFKKPTTDFKVIEELMETKIALLKMKAKYYQLDGYTSLIERQSDKSNVESRTLYHVSEVAKMFYDEFKLGRNQLFDKLRELKLFYRRGKFQLSLSKIHRR